MRNARFGLMAGLAGATLCLFAVTSYGQNPTTTTSAQTPAPTTPTATDQTTPAPTDAGAATTATDVGTTTTTFPGGVWGIVAVVALVLILLFAVLRGRDRTVIRETYASSSASSPGTRGTATTADDRSRAASGTGQTSDGMNDPNARR